MIVIIHLAMLVPIKSFGSVPPFLSFSFGQVNSAVLLASRYSEVAVIVFKISLKTGVTHFKRYISKWKMQHSRIRLPPHQTAPAV